MGVQEVEGSIRGVWEGKKLRGEYEEGAGEEEEYRNPYSVPQSSHLGFLDLRIRDRKRGIYTIQYRWG